MCLYIVINTHNNKSMYVCVCMCANVCVNVCVQTRHYIYYTITIIIPLHMLHIMPFYMRFMRIYIYGFMQFYVRFIPFHGVFADLTTFAMCGIIWYTWYTHDTCNAHAYT